MRTSIGGIDVNFNCIPLGKVQNSGVACVSIRGSVGTNVHVDNRYAISGQNVGLNLIPLGHDCHGKDIHPGDRSSEDPECVAVGGPNVCNHAIENEDLLCSCMCDSRRQGGKERNSRVWSGANVRCKSFF